ncbi:TPA: radical SAM protein [Yersinia enterocolitica]|nr:radical SAM protein [Yersinia enterocolitica]HEN3572552.1 radical SAM protein [Yersinia enterocolitica]HEN3633586.1 radical SAM protein [Yersinia enterocolitica]HEN3651746.1 radical SAM protein [Yersinia enterocolitica]HEN3659977.1 radical SAM protein [Yersinia enterocolitica]
MVNQLNIQSIQHLEIILKISERCNINCDYCYVFNKGNPAANNSPARLSDKNINALAELLHTACREYKIGTLQIDFHGGEPLLMKKENFAKMCERLPAGKYSKTNVRFALQTNGTLIDEEWISLFEKYSVNASISIDGPKHINGRHRLDTKGRSTYEATVRGLRILQHAHKQGRIPSAPGVLCVANAQANGAEIYRHFVDDTLRATSDRIFNPIGHVSEISLTDALNSPQFQEYTSIGQSLPHECNGCIWENVCAGGRIMNRFSPETRFDRKSVYCYSMRSFLSRSAAHLLNMGIKEERIMTAISR